MHNPGEREGGAAFSKTCPTIKTGRRVLCVETDVRQATGPGQLQQSRQQRTTNAASTPGRQHGHPANPAFRRQSTGSHGVTCVVAGQYMPAVRVQIVPFQRGGNTLFDNEHGITHGTDGSLVMAPVGLAHGKPIGCRHA